MAALIGALRAVLGVNTAQYEAGFRRARRTSQGFAAGIQRDLAVAQRSASRAFTGIAAAAGTFGAALGIRTFASYVDAAKNLEAQLRLATRESGSFAQAQEDVRRISQASRSDIEATANLYSVFQRNARELNITQAEAAQLTETVTKSFQISGATAAEAAGGLRQFLQGMQSGTLRGEELNSVLENAPRLARALAEGLGVTIGELRRMGQEGELTGERVTNAILGAAEAINEEFSTLPVTFDQAMTQMRNAAITFAGAFDRGGEFSDALINFAGTGEMSFDQIEQKAFQTGAEIRSVIAGLSDVFDPMGQGASNVFDFILSEARGLRDAIADILGTLDGVFNALGESMAALGNWAINLYNSGQMVAGALTLNPNTHRITSRFVVDPSNMGGRFRQRSEAELAGRTQNAGIGRAWAEQQRWLEQQHLGPRPPSVSGGGGGSGSQRRRGGGGSAEAAARRAERERLDALRDEHEFQSDLRRFRQDQLRLQQEMAVDFAERFEIGNRITELERQQYQADLSIRIQLGELDDVRAQQLQAAYDAVDAEQRIADSLELNAQARREQLELANEYFDIQRSALEHEADMADTASERRAAELRLLDLVYRHERARLQEILAAEELGQVTHAEAAIARARLRALDAEFSRDRTSVFRSTMGPLESFLNSLPNTAARVNEALQAIAAEGLQSITDGLADAITGARSWGDVMRDVIQQIIRDLIRLQLARMLAGLFGGFGGGTSGAAALGAKLFSGTQGLPGFASGGSFTIGGSPGVDRNVLSLNGSPVARVSRGETVDVRNGQRGGVVEIRLRDEMLDARIEEGAGVTLVRAYPAMRADTASYIAGTRRRQG